VGELYPRDLTEKRFQAQVVELARMSGFTTYHTYDSRRSSPGFPDLVIVKKGMGRPIFAELKTNKGKLSEPQEEWKEILEEIPGANYKLWRPSSWSEIEQILTRRK
jgi:VRR-NUC domain